MNKWIKCMLFQGVALLLLLGANAWAEHNWNNYHWARTINPFPLSIIDSMSSDWDYELEVAIIGEGSYPGWNDSTVLDLTLVPGSDSK